MKQDKGMGTKEFHSSAPILLPFSYSIIPLPFIPLPFPQDSFFLK